MRLRPEQPETAGDIGMENEFTKEEIEALEQKRLEELFEELEQVLETLEEGGTGLEESFRLYRRGQLLSRLCRDKIDGVEKQLIVLSEQEEE